MQCRNGLSQAEKDRIALYLNFDMIGSPNYIFMVYDADQSSFTAPVPVPPGSTAIEDLFESFYTLSDEPYDDAEFSGRSDYQAFNSDAVAFAVLTYAYSTQTVNGVPGKKMPDGKFTIPAPAGPEGTVGSGGGAEHDET